MDELINWGAFNAKYNKRESWAFEQLCYLLFCAEFNNRIGLFRYKNQTGIETEPIEKNGKYYGFQSKYYTSSIDENKNDIIDSIEKAKSKNPQLDEFYLYLNQEFSESSNKNKKKPQYQIDIENAAQNAGLTLQWKVSSHLERQLSLPENKYIYDIFFNLNPNEGNLIDDLYSHNESILQVIQTEIPFGTNSIKIDRTSIIEELAKEINAINIVLTGEGGCGKTAVFKEFYYSNRKKFPICVFKANELNVNRINDVFQFDHSYSLTQFIEAFTGEAKKVFVIDSAERLAEISNNEIVNELIQTLKKNEWSILFISRYAYLNDLLFYIQENYQLPYKTIDIPLIDLDALSSIANERGFILPNNINFTERLKNLFYLKEFLIHYSDIDKQGNYRSFVDLLWKKRIQSTDQKDNIHLEREKCVIDIARRRSESGHFYINADNLPQSPLFRLTQDEILVYDATHNGYFFAHDIYEEWALNKIVSRCFANCSDAIDFINQLGNSLPMRRAYRMWLSDQLLENNNALEDSIYEVFISTDIPQFWKDELLISVLLSDYSDSFFESYENEIKANDYEMLKRMLFLLNIACTDISSNATFDSFEPKGKGWESAISFIYNKAFDFFENNIKFVLPILSKWSISNKVGATTKYIGLLSLTILKYEETKEHFYIDSKIENELMSIVFNCSRELESELKIIFDKIIAKKWFNHSSPYYDLCSTILSKPYYAYETINTLPLCVIQLCDSFWKKHVDEDEYFDDNSDMESRYGLTDHFEFDYFPPSANQTPIRWLLRVELKKALDFIIRFTNDCVESYSKSDYGIGDVKTISLRINKTEVHQFISNALWCMYRGFGSPVVPYVLQSIHMALEQYLLEVSTVYKKETVQSILQYILANSKSASLTSIVCSVVLAFPDKFHETALILFKAIDLFHYDAYRSSNEFEAKSLYSMSSMLDEFKTMFYTEERLKTCDEKHRSLCLESLFLQYQLFGTNGFTEEQNSDFIYKLYNIIDEYKTDPKINDKHGLLLARMDRRNLNPNITPRDDNSFIIEFTPKELSDEHKKEIEDGKTLYETAFKYSSLRIWSDFISEAGRDSHDPQYKEYEKDSLLALADTKHLIEEINKGRRSSDLFEYSIPAFSCSKLFIQHKEVLSQEDKVFCREIILSFISQLFSDDYDYQISDGTEAAIQAIPALIDEFPDETYELLLLLVLVLLDKNQLGSYKRICDYAIESIFRANLWELNPNVAQKILFGYIKIQPIYNKILVEQRKISQRAWGAVPKNTVLNELDKEIGNFEFKNLSIGKEDLERLDIRALEIVYQLIPSDTADKTNCDIILQSLPFILPQILDEYRVTSDTISIDSGWYWVKQNLQKRIACFLLQRDVLELDVFLKPIVESLISSKEVAEFIEEFVSAEDQLNHPKQFWYIWNKFYPKIVDIYKNSNNYHFKNLIIDYLLAWNWWKKDVTGWHSLQKEHLSFYKAISKDMGEFPPVLYSIAKILCSIGFSFDNEGLEWIFTIVSNNKTMDLADLKSNTIYYLESFVRRYVYSNKQKIKKETSLRNKIIPILDFMIERNSVHAYLLRESIII